jgi:hypothetical protein
VETYVPPTVPKTYESIKESCYRNDCSRSEYYRLLGAGKIEAVKDGTRIKVIVESADAYFRSLPKAKIKPDKRARAVESTAA